MYRSALTRMSSSPPPWPEDLFDLPPLMQNTTPWKSSEPVIDDHHRKNMLGVRGATPASSDPYIPINGYRRENGEYVQFHNGPPDHEYPVRRNMGRGRGRARESLGLTTYMMLCAEARNTWQTYAQGTSFVSLLGKCLRKHISLRMLYAMILLMGTPHAHVSWRFLDASGAGRRTTRPVHPRWHISVRVLDSWNMAIAESV